MIRGRRWILMGVPYQMRVMPTSEVGVTVTGEAHELTETLCSDLSCRNHRRGGGAVVSRLPLYRRKQSCRLPPVVRSGWSVVIRSAMEPSLLVEVTERHADRVTVSRTRDILELEVADTTNYTDARFYAELSVPDSHSREQQMLTSAAVRPLTQRLPSPASRMRTS